MDDLYSPYYLLVGYIVCRRPTALAKIQDMNFSKRMYALFIYKLANSYWLGYLYIDYTIDITNFVKFV
jgi:hypothetical protein